MGVTYKLKPEVEEFILEQKKAIPALSCRGLTALVKEKFGLEVSKSSINGLIKRAGLSAPVGRRLKHKKHREELGEKIKLLFDKTVKPAAEIPILEPPKEVAPEQPPVEKPIELPEKVAPEQSPVEKPIEIPVEKKPEEPAPVKVEEPAKIEEPVKAEEPVKPEPEEKPVEAPVEEKPTAPVPEVEKVNAALEDWQGQETTGAILLKAADYLINGSTHINLAIKNRLNLKDDDSLAKIESLLYLSLFEEQEEKDFSGLWALSGKKMPQNDINSYLDYLQSFKTISLDLWQHISNSLQEVRVIKVNLTDGNTLYLDGQLYTIWSTPYTPYDFSAPLENIKNALSKYFYEDSPFVFFMAPGYETPTKEFFSFAKSLGSRDKKINSLTLYGNKFEELEILSLHQARKRHFIFGLWPWQFAENRRVSNIGEFRPFDFAGSRKTFYSAEMEVELTHPQLNERISLRGAAIKTGQDEKTRLVILGNFSKEEMSPADMAKIYLSKWPNLDETFRDYSRKIELFTYTGASQRFFSSEIAELIKEPPYGIQALFYKYLQSLDLYLRWHLLPVGYEQKDFQAVKTNFYNLSAKITKTEKEVLVSFVLPPAYAFKKDLEYICSRLNEKEIRFFNGKRAWFVV